MKRVALIHPHLTPNGGSSALAIWTVEALRHVTRLSLITWQTPDIEALNRTFGTSLRSGDIEIVQPGATVRRVVDALPGRGRLIRRNLLLRLCQARDREDPFDVLLHTDDESRLPRPGIQYVHSPHAFRPPPQRERTLVQTLPGAIGLYRAFAGLLWNQDFEAIRRNRTLVNSQYIRGRVRELYGIDSEVVFPPVPGGFVEVPWGERENAIAYVARLCKYKRQLEVVAIVEELRRRGHDLALHLVGTPEDDRYVDRLRAAVETRPWARLHVDLPRDEMVRLLSRQRYGIHAMVGEHFGIGPAELVRAGCITFVPRLGGPAEIVDHHPALLFDRDAEAVERLEAVLGDVALQTELREHLAERGRLFSAGRFVEEMRRVVVQG